MQRRPQPLALPVCFQPTEGGDMARNREAPEACADGLWQVGSEGARHCLSLVTGVYSGVTASSRCCLQRNIRRLLFSGPDDLQRSARGCCRGGGAPTARRFARRVCATGHGHRARDEISFGVESCQRSNLRHRWLFRLASAGARLTDRWLTCACCDCSGATEKWADTAFLDAATSGRAVTGRGQASLPVCSWRAKETE
jgi:hypothetical protein